MPAPSRDHSLVRKHDAVVVEPCGRAQQLHVALVHDGLVEADHNVGAAVVAGFRRHRSARVSAAGGTVGARVRHSYSADANSRLLTATRAACERSKPCDSVCEPSSTPTIHVAQDGLVPPHLTPCSCSRDHVPSGPASILYRATKAVLIRFHTFDSSIPHNSLKQGMSNTEH